VLKNVKNGYIDFDCASLIFEETNLLHSFIFVVRSIGLSRYRSREEKFQGKS
jgi:hypothetical protein